MSRKKKTSVNWVLPGIILVLICTSFTVLFFARDSSNRPSPATIPHEGEGERAVTLPTANGLLPGQVVTNQPGAEGPEDRVVALTAEGNQLLARGNYAEAAKKFEQAVAISPEQEDLHYNLAIALAKLGKSEEAKKQYEEALRIFPEYAEAHNNLGNMLMNENQPEAAINHLREAVKNTPENASFHNNLGTAFGRSGKVAEAMGEFEEAIKQNPTYVEARVNLANALLSVGRADDAIVQLNEALRLKPDFKPALQAMQRARQRQDSSKIPK